MKTAVTAVRKRNGGTPGTDAMDPRQLAEMRRIHLEGTCLGIVIGDRSVSMTEAHVDKSGVLIRLHEESVNFVLPRDRVLSIRQIREGIVTCRQNFLQSAITHCVVMLPSFGSSARAATGSLPIASGWGPSAGRPAPVTDDHVARLVRQIVRQRTTPGQVVTGVAYDRFVLANGLSVDDPRDERTTELSAHLHLFSTDFGIARAVMDILAGQELTVDALATPSSALGALLAPADGVGDVLLVEMSDRHAGCGFFRCGFPMRISGFEWGRDDLVAGAAGRLQVEEGALSRWLAEKGDVLLDPDAPASRLLPMWSDRQARFFSVGEVESALDAEGTAMAARIREAMDSAAREIDIRPSRVVLMGDSPALLRAVAAAGARHSPVVWQVGEVREHPRDHVDPFVLDRTRMAAVLRFGAHAPPAECQPYLTTYRRIPGRGEIQDAMDGWDATMGKATTAWRSARPRLQHVGRRLARAAARVAALFV